MQGLGCGLVVTNALPGIFIVNHSRDTWCSYFSRLIDAAGKLFLESRKRPKGALILTKSGNQVSVNHLLWGEEDVAAKSLGDLRRLAYRLPQSVDRADRVHAGGL